MAFSRRALAALAAAPFAATRAQAQPLQAQPPQAQSAQAQSPSAWSPPEAAQRCPSRWGAADKRGSMNLQTPAQAMKAAQQIRSGRIIELGHVLEQGMPFFGTRRFDVHLKRTFMNPEANRRGSNEEMVLSEIGQVGTQFDAFPHQTIGEDIYNCNKYEAIAARGGFTDMGVETVGTIFTRGVLIDVAGTKGVPTLPDDYEITVADLEAAMKRREVTVEKGDAVIINTGWGLLWGKENARYVRSCPGLGVAASEFLLAREPILLGADNWPVEVAPSKTLPAASLPLHQLALVVHGVHLLENMKLQELAAADATAFAFALQPLKIKGGTGSTVAPSAIL